MFLLFCYAVPPTHLQLSIIRARALTNGIQQLIHSAPMIEKHWSYVAVTLKTKRKSTTPENSLAAGGSFERNTFLVMVLDWLKKERKKERKKEDEQF